MVLIHPAPDKDRLISRRRRKSSVAQLNLPILAAHADDRFDVRILDENIEEVDVSTVEADIVGITLMTCTALRGYEIADCLRLRGMKVILGGMHVFFLQDEALAHADATERLPSFIKRIVSYLNARSKYRLSSPIPMTHLQIPPRL